MINRFWGVAVLLHPFIIRPSFNPEGIRTGRDLFMLFASVLALFLFGCKANKKIVYPVAGILLVGIFNQAYYTKIAMFDHTSYFAVYQSCMFIAGLICLAQFSSMKVNLAKYISISGLIASIYMFLDFFDIDLIRYYCELMGFVAKNSNQVEGALLNKNLSGAYIAMTIPAIIEKKKYWYLVPVFGAILLCDSTIPIYTAVASCFFILVKNSYMRALFLSPIPAAYFLMEHTKGGLDSARFLIWESALNVYHSSFFGEGLGWVSGYFNKVKRPLGSTGVAQLHNEFLELYMSFGVVGIAALAYVLFLSFRSNNIVAKSGVFALLANSMGNFPMHISPIALIGLYYLGVTLRGDNLCQDDGQAKL